MSSAPSSTASCRSTKWLKAVSQVLLLTLIWFSADQGARILGLPISGGIFGLFILVVLLLAGIIKPSWVEGGAELILANMLLYFIPLVVSVVQYTDLFETEGLKLMVAIGVGFLSVLVITALVVDWVYQMIRKRHYSHLIAVRRSRAVLLEQNS